MCRVARCTTLDRDRNRDPSRRLCLGSSRRESITITIRITIKSRIRFFRRHRCGFRKFWQCACRPLATFIHGQVRLCYFVASFVDARTCEILPTPFCWSWRCLGSYWRSAHPAINKVRDKARDKVAKRTWCPWTKPRVQYRCGASGSLRPQQRAAATPET